MNNIEQFPQPKLSEEDQDHAIQERLISNFEQNRCPTCDRDTGILEGENWTGFCGETCFQEYEKTDPNLANLTLAQGEFNYRHSLEKDAKDLGMDVSEYRKLREEQKLSKAEIREQMENQDQYKKAA
ncbi:MAG: hypothetical protein WCT49_04400 [Candidatus Paceibacterota bacterium]|jgi:hypothetical protein|nr:hypothetical protein [Candidatus Paceibacterota bacterium]